MDIGKLQYIPASGTALVTGAAFYDGMYALTQDGTDESMDLLMAGLAVVLPGETRERHYCLLLPVQVAASLVAAIYANADENGKLDQLNAEIDQRRAMWKEVS